MTKHLDKNTFLPCKKASHYFSYIFYPFNIHFFVAMAVFCWTHNKNVLSKTQLWKHTVSKQHFSPIPKNTFFPQEKVSFLVLRSFRWKTTIFLVFPGFGRFHPPKFLAKTECAQKCRVFSPFPTQLVAGNVLKIHCLSIRTLVVGDTLGEESLAMRMRLQQDRHSPETRI